MLAAPADIHSGNPHVEFLLTNGPAAVLTSFNQSSTVLREQAQDHFATMSKVQGLVLLGVAMLFDLFLTAAVLPIVNHFEASKDRILKVFLDVPA